MKMVLAQSYGILRSLQLFQNTLLNKLKLLKTRQQGNTYPIFKNDF